MKTAKFSDILIQTCQLIGLDVDTLNLKSYNVIRDLLSRRMLQIWDREEWPDTQRYMNTYPGVPIQYVQPDLIGDAITTQAGDILVTGDGYNLSWNTEWTTRVYLKLYQQFPRIFLKDFSDNSYNLETITSSSISILNPFYIDNVSVSDIKYNFEIEEGNYDDGNGPFVMGITLIFPNGFQLTNASINYPNQFSTYWQFPNQKITSTISFAKNPHLLIKLDDAELQGIEIFNSDPRSTTRRTIENFLVEDFYDVQVGSEIYSENSSYLRVYNSGQKFVKYRIPATRLFGSVFDPFLTYNPGDQVFYLQEFWNCIAPSEGTVPQTPSSTWEIAPIPYRFKDFLVNAIACDFLRSEARFEEAEVLNNMAEIAVQQQIDVLLRQQGQVQRMNMAYTY